MGSSPHITSEGIEQEIISLAKSYPSINHDFDDCGIISNAAKHLETIIIDVNDVSAFDAIPKRKYLDAFLSLQVNRNKNVDYKEFFSKLDSFLSDHDSGIRKGETTFIEEGDSYGVLVLTYAGDELFCGTESFVSLGSIDTYIGGRHFLLDRDPAQSGFYATCGAISDIGASGGRISDIAITVINPKSSQFIDRFRHGASAAARFCNVDLLCMNTEKNVPHRGEMAFVYTVRGRAPKNKVLTLKGLEEGMHVYVAGFVGGAAAAGYDTEPDLLRPNLDPQLRYSVREAITLPALCNDVSDGVDKCFHNLLRHADGLYLDISESELMKARHNEDVTLDNIKFGGDDYALVFATHQDISLHKVIKVGEVKKGEKKVNYS